MSIASSVPASALPPLYRWQKAALQATHEILGRAQHLYVSAPTASGKSRYMFEAGESLDVPGERVIVVGMGPIVAQHRESFIEFGCSPISEEDECETFLTPRGYSFTITTWQGLVRREARPIGVLMFDECHIGGSGQDAKTIPTIFEKFTPTKRIYVSATTQTANEDLLGKKSQHLYRYTYAEAYEDGILHPVDLVEVHTGINVQIAEIQAATGKNMTDFEELSSKDLHELAGKLEERSIAYGVNAQDIENKVKGVVRHRHKSMIELYLHRHPGQQAIFFSPSVEAAEDAAAMFNSRARRKGVAEHAHVCHSGVKDSGAVISRFRSGEIKVVFVVGMLQEGFNLDSLWLAFDCRFHGDWNDSRIARLVQRLGRLMRRPEPGKSKPTSLYYYARDIQDFYRHTGVLTPETPLVCEDDELATHASPESFEKITPEGASVYAGRILDAAEQQGEETPLWSREIETNPTQIEQIVIVDHDGISPPTITPITTATTPLYVIRRLRNHTVVRTYNAACLFGSCEVDRNKAALLALPVGSPRPSRKSPLGRALTRYTAPSTNAYDAVFDKLIRAKHPNWWEDQVAEKKRLLLEMPVGSPRPSGNHPLKRALSSYTQKSSPSYDPVFDAEIRARQPSWFYTTKPKTTQVARANVPLSTQQTLLLAQELPLRTSHAQVIIFQLIVQAHIEGRDLRVSDLADLAGKSRDGEPVLGAGARRTYQFFLKSSREVPDGLGWVELETDPDDSRSKFLRLTEDGLAIVERVWGAAA